MALFGTTGEVRAEHKRYLFTNLTVADGIGGGEISSIIQDKRGYMWFATQMGLNRYDGYEVRIFRHSQGLVSSLSGDDVTAICEGSQGWIWVGTRTRGLNRYDPASETFLPVPNSGELFGESEITDILETADGKLWVGTRAGLFQLKRHRMERGRVALAIDGEPAEGSESKNDLMVEVLFEDETGTLWVGTRSHGLCYLDNETSELRPVWNGGVGVASLAQDAKGVLWLGTLGGGIVCVDPVSKQSLGPLAAEGLPGRDVGPIYRDSSGTMWVGMRQGLCRFDAATNSFQIYRYESEGAGAPLQGGIRSIYEDRKRVLWAGGSSGGISRFNLDGVWFEHQRNLPGARETISQNGVWAFLENADGTVWVGTEGGLNLYDPTIGRVVQRPPEDSPYYVSSLARGPDGEIFVGTKGAGLREFDPETKEYLPVGVGKTPLEGNAGDRSVGTARGTALQTHSMTQWTITSLLVDSGGRLWAGTEGYGLAVLERGAEKLNLYRVTGGGGSECDFVTSLEQGPMDSVWVGTLGGGLHLMDGESKTSMTLSDWAAERGIRAKLPTNHIQSLALVGRSLLVGTSSEGISKVDMETGDVSKFGETRGGGPQGVVSGIVEDSSGLIWAANGAGLARIDPATLSYRGFDIHDGLQSDIFNPGACYKTRDGKLYFGGPNGFNVIDPARLPGEVASQRPILTGLELFGERVVPSKDGVLRRPLALTDVLELPFDKAKRVAFTFATLSYATPHRSRFRFRMEGLEEGWTVVDKERKASYTGLAPGVYTFHVQSTIGGKGWTGDTVSLPIKVLPPWHETWWARISLIAGSIILISLVIAFLLRSNLQRMRQRENDLDMARSKAEAALSRQLQNAMLLEQTTDRIRHNIDGGKLFHGALEQLCYHFQVDACRLHHFKLKLGSTPKLSLLAEHPDHSERAEGADRADVLKLEMSGGEGTDPRENGMDDGEETESAELAIADSFAEAGNPEPVGEPGSAMPEFDDALLVLNGQDPSDLPLGDPFIQQVLEHDKAVIVVDIDVSSPCDSALTKRLKGFGARSVAAVRTSYMGGANGLILLFDQMPREWKQDEIKLFEAIAAQVGIALAQVEMARKEERQREDLQVARKIADDANRAKSDFLAKMTHELRTPLNAILGFSRLLEEDKETTARQLKIINIVNSSGEHLLDIINDVLEMSKIESGKMELNEAPFDLCEMLDSVENMLGHKARSQGLRFAVIRENDLPSVIDADRGKLRQSLVNLLGNAIKFTEEGGITVKVRSEPIQTGGRISPTANPVTGTDRGADLRLHFSVRDTGKGIAEEEIENLFKKFVQTESGRKSHQGTGLGLAITAYFVEMMGGEVKVTSEPGKWTEFSFSITCRRADSSPRPAGRSSAKRVVSIAPGQDPIRVLVAEDQMVNRMLLTRILRSAGFEIEEAENGAIAVAKWESYQPHLIFMDQDMPVMKGSEATRAICERAGENRPAIVALTAYALDEARANAMEAGCDDFLSKPFNKDELFEVIARHISVRYTYVGDQPELPAPDPDGTMLPA